MKVEGAEMSERKSKTSADEAERPEPVAWTYSAPWLKFLRRHIWKVGAVYGLVFITCWSGVQAYRRNEVPPALGEVHAANLVDSANHVFNRESMRGKVWIVGFVFTRCGSICPAVSKTMQLMQEEIRRSKLGDDVNLLSVSVDPAFDTPEVFAKYATSLGADPSLWSFVTGDANEVTNFVVDGFKLAIGEAKESAPGVFDIAHSSKLALVDRHGKIRGYFSATGTPEELEVERKRLYSALFPAMRASADQP
jgi:protein SCO1/2